MMLCNLRRWFTSPASVGKSRPRGPFRGRQLSLEVLEDRLCMTVSTTVNLDSGTVHLPVTTFFGSELHQVLAGETVYFNVQMTSKDPNEDREDSGPEPLLLYAVPAPIGVTPINLPAGAQPFATLSKWNLDRQVPYSATDDNVVFFARIQGADRDEEAKVEAFVKPKTFGRVGMGGTGLALGSLGVVTWVAGKLGAKRFPGIDKITDWVGAGLTTAGLATAKLALDPPDPNYTVIDPAVAPVLPPLTAGDAVTQQLADASNALLDNLTQVIGLDRAMLTAENRASGAQQVGDTYWVSQQQQALDGFSLRLGALLNAEPALLANFRSALEGAGVSTTVTAQDVTAFTQDLSQNGLSVQATAALTALGVDSVTAEQIKDYAVVQDPQDIAGDLTQKLTDPQLVATLQTTAASMGPADPQPGYLAVVANAISHSAEYYINIVTAAYQRYLGRPPEDAGLNGWVNAMQHGYSDELLEAGFIGSPEYIAKHGGTGAEWVKGMYRDLLGREPDAAGLAGWINALNGGMDPAAIAYGFAASPERETQRITADYRTYLGRPPEDAGVVGRWVNAFEGGYSNENVVGGFVGSPEYFGSAAKGRGHKADWLSSLYQDVLHREVSPTEIQSWDAVLR